MSFLANVLKETLRLFPSVPVNTRTAHQTTILPVGGGSNGQSPVLVRRDENVAYCIYAMHRRKDLYGHDAEDFRPERWEEQNLPLYRDSVSAAWGYLPFSGGPRVCLGQDFGLVGTSYALVRILQEFPTIKEGSFERSQTQSWLGLLTAAALSGLRESEKSYGITQLYSGEDPVVDIIAIHGLNGHALKTWTSEESQSSWLQDKEMLPKILRNARILTWGYDANVTALLGSTSSDRILQHAQTLVANLEADRSALIYSANRTSKYVAHLHSIFVSTHSVLFLGTPHHGSDVAKLAGTFQRTVAALIPRKTIDTNDQLLNALQAGSETLQNITDEFAPLMNFHLYFFWEQEKTNLGYTWDYVVHESSAAPLLDDTERAGIPAPHALMCKFSHKRSPGYRTVVAALQRYTREAPDVVETRWRRAKERFDGLRRGEAEELIPRG
ncbi:hypothetical protein MMC22_000269 [Lobaria immixta]|nr:hypothetical protein [Lobaria immixta]